MNTQSRTLRVGVPWIVSLLVLACGGRAPDERVGSGIPSTVAAPRDSTPPTALGDEPESALYFASEGAPRDGATR
jgi:hypothetical protein